MCIQQDFITYLIYFRFSQKKKKINKRWILSLVAVLSWIFHVTHLNIALQLWWMMTMFVMNNGPVPLHHSATRDIMNMQHFDIPHLARALSTPAKSSPFLNFSSLSSHRLCLSLLHRYKQQNEVMMLFNFKLGSMPVSGMLTFPTAWDCFCSKRTLN